MSKKSDDGKPRPTAEVIPLDAYRKTEMSSEGRIAAFQQAISKFVPDQEAGFVLDDELNEVPVKR
jgi:hypothetical protein